MSLLFRQGMDALQHAGSCQGTKQVFCCELGRRMHKKLSTSVSTFAWAWKGPRPYRIA
jgi:hypothetical protein